MIGTILQYMDGSTDCMARAELSDLGSEDHETVEKHAGIFKQKSISSTYLFNSS